jgi:hypothetical protein
LCRLAGHIQKAKMCGVRPLPRVPEGILTNMTGAPVLHHLTEQNRCEVPNFDGFSGQEIKVARPDSKCDSFFRTFLGRFGALLRLFQREGPASD